MVRIMEEDFNVFDFSRVDRALAEQQLATAEVIDLCEKAGYKPTLEVDKPKKDPHQHSSQG